MRFMAGRWLLPPSVALLYRENSHERFHRVDFAVVNFERLPNRELVAAALAHAPGHAQPDDAHALIDGDDARLNITEAIEYRERLRRDVLTTGGKRAFGTRHHLAVFVAIGIGSEGRVHVGKSLRGVEPGRIMQRRLDGIVTGRKLLGARCV